MAADLLYEYENPGAFTVKARALASDLDAARIAGAFTRTQGLEFSGPNQILATDKTGHTGIVSMPSASILLRGAGTDIGPGSMDPFDPNDPTSLDESTIFGFTGGPNTMVDRDIKLIKMSPGKVLATARIDSTQVPDPLLIPFSFGSFSKEYWHPKTLAWPFTETLDHTSGPFMFVTDATSSATSTINLPPASDFRRGVIWIVANPTGTYSPTRPLIVFAGTGASVNDESNIIVNLGTTILTIIISLPSNRYVLVNLSG